MTTTTPTHHRTNSKYLPKDWLVPGLEPQTKAAKKVVTIVICVLWYACNISVVLLSLSSPDESSLVRPRSAEL